MIATSTGASAKAANAMIVSTSKKLSRGAARLLAAGVDHVEVRLELVVEGDERLRAQRLAVQRDPFAHVGEVRADESPGPQAVLADQPFDHARGRGLAVRAGHVDDAVGVLRVAEQAAGRRDPVQGRAPCRSRAHGRGSRRTPRRAVPLVAAAAALRRRPRGAARARWGCASRLRSYGLLGSDGPLASGLGLY